MGTSRHILRGQDGRVYEFVEQLGAGGFAEVHLVRAPDRRVYACKLFREPEGPERDVRPSATDAMENEWQALDKLRGSALFPTPHDRGVHEGQPFLIEDYVPGLLLRDVLDRFGPLDPGAVLDMVDSLARGLSHAHRRGVVHRDLASHNIMLTIDEGGSRRRVRAHILDPGLARVHLRGDHRALSMMYSPGYTAPERLRPSDGPHPPHAAEDYFSLGAVAFESLCGKLPFGRFGPRQLPPPNARPGWPTRVPPPVRAVINTLLAIDPDERPASFDALADALVRARQAEPTPEKRTLDWIATATRSRTHAAPEPPAPDEDALPTTGPLASLTGRAGWLDALPAPAALALGLLVGGLTMGGFALVDPYDRLLAGSGVLSIVAGIAWRARWVAVPDDAARGQGDPARADEAADVGNEPKRGPRPTAQPATRPMTIGWSTGVDRYPTTGRSTDGPRVTVPLLDEPAAALALPSEPQNTRPIGEGDQPEPVAALALEPPTDDEA